MNTPLIAPLLPSMTSVKPPDPGHKGSNRTREAAEQFESLLISQMLGSARRASGGIGWLGGEEEASSSMLEFAEQQIASMLSKSGGFGLSDMIEQGLRPKTRETAGSATDGLSGSST